MNLDELKSKAYDALAQIEAWQGKLKDLNQQITDYKETEAQLPKEE